jgi:hypothetical protein
VNRERLAQLADALIPAEDGMPSASEAGATGRWLEAVLRARPDLRAPVENREPDALTSAIVAAYYLNPDVRHRIGYAGQLALPLGPPDHEELLESVRARGPLYRPTP